MTFKVIFPPSKLKQKSSFISREKKFMIDKENNSGFDKFEIY
jgi:hypothetical protein